jgi:hypothetical protein
VSQLAVASVVLAGIALAGYLALARWQHLGFVRGALYPLLIAAVAAGCGHLALRRRRNDDRVMARSGLAVAYATVVLCLITAVSALITHTVSATSPTINSLPAVPAPPYSGGDPVQPPQAPQQRDDGPSRPGPPLSQDPRAPGTLQGSVVDANGAPVAGATVTVRRADPTDTSETPACPLDTSTSTDASGQWSLRLCQLADGLGYAVRVQATGQTVVADLAFVNSGQVTTWVVRLR